MVPPVLATRMHGTYVMQTDYICGHGGGDHNSRTLERKEQYHLGLMLSNLFSQLLL
jgi:hypothetical protein